MGCDVPRAKASAFEQSATRVTRLRVTIFVSAPDLGTVVLSKG